MSRRTPGPINEGVISSSSSLDDEGESSRHDSHGYTSSHLEEENWDDAYDEIDPSDSASASADYKHPPRPHSARPPRSTERRHKISSARQSFTYRAPPAPPMSVDPSDDYPPSFGRGYGPPHSYYGAGRPPQPNYPQSHVGGFMPPPPSHHYASQAQVVPYNNYQQNPFAPMGGPNGANYFNEHRPPYDMIPYQGAGYFAGAGGPGGPGGYGMPPPHLQQFMYGNPPAPPPTEAPGAPTTPAPAAERKPVDPEVENMKAQLELFRAEQARKDADVRQKELEAKIRRDAEESLQRRIEEMRKAQEEAKKDIERAKAEAERAARDKIEAERKAEDERRRLHEETMKQAEREARQKLEAEMRALEERRKREVREEEERRRHHAETLRRAELEAREKLEAEMKAMEERKRLEAEAAAAAEAAARARIEAAMKAEAEAREAAERKAAEELEWRKKLEEDAKLKAEIDARAKLEAEKQAAEDAKAAEEQKKKDDEAMKKRILEEAKIKVEEAAKKKDKPPIKFKDAVGRKFSFPYHLCQTWPGMEELIKQAFLHVDVIGPHVQEGHYDLIGPNGEIILPTVWEKVVEPDWSITMQMWPMDKAPLQRQMPMRPGPPPFPPGDPRNDPRHPHHRPAGAAVGGMPQMPGMRPNTVRPPGMAGGPVPGPPPPGWAERGGMGPAGNHHHRRGAPAAVVVDADPPRVKRSSKSSNKGVLDWMAGNKPPKGTKKKR